MPQSKADNKSKTKKPVIKDVRDHRKVLETLDRTARVETEKRRLSDVMFTTKDTILNKLIQEYLNILDGVEKQDRLSSKKVIVSPVVSVERVNSRRDQLRDYVIHAIVAAEEAYAKANAHKAHKWAEMHPEQRDRLVHESCMYSVDDEGWEALYQSEGCRYSTDLNWASKIAAAHGIGLLPVKVAGGFMWSASYKKYDQRFKVRNLNPAAAICLAALQKIGVLVDIPPHPREEIE